MIGTSNSPHSPRVSPRAAAPVMPLRPLNDAKVPTIHSSMLLPSELPSKRMSPFSQATSRLATPESKRQRSVDDTLITLVGSSGMPRRTETRPLDATTAISPPYSPVMHRWTRGVSLPTSFRRPSRLSSKNASARRRSSRRGAIRENAAPPRSQSGSLATSQARAWRARSIRRAERPPSV